MITGNLSGVARPGFGIRRAFGVLHRRGEPLSLGQVMAETAAVEGLSAVIARALVECRTADGRVDTRDVADYLLRALRPRKPSVDLSALIESTTANNALACLITEALDSQQTSSGHIDTRDVAAFVLAEMRNHQR